MIAEMLRNILPDIIKEQTYIGELPTDKDDCIAIQESGGPHKYYFAAQEMDTPYIRIVIRNSSYVTGEAIARQCKQILTGYVGEQLFNVLVTNDISYKGRDDKRRNLWQFSLKIFYRR